MLGMDLPTVLVSIKCDMTNTKQSLFTIPLFTEAVRLVTVWHMIK